MSDNTKSCITFAVGVAVVCLIAWVGGYDFDRRGDDVAMGVIFGLWASGMAAMLVRSDFP